MRFLGVAVILAIVGVLLVSSGVATVGPPIGPANAGPAPAADASRLLHARALKSNAASSRTVKGTPPSASSSCSGCLRVGAAGRFAGDRSRRLARGAPERGLVQGRSRRRNRVAPPRAARRRGRRAARRSQGLSAFFNASRRPLRRAPVYNPEAISEGNEQ